MHLPEPCKPNFVTVESAQATSALGLSRPRLIAPARVILDDLRQIGDHQERLYRAKQPLDIRGEGL